MLNQEDILRLLAERKGKATLGALSAELHSLFLAHGAGQELRDRATWEEDAEGKKICPLCNQTCYWAKLTFKKRYVEAMRILRKAMRPLTFKEIAALAAEDSANFFNETYFRYFTEARHWDLLSGTGEIRNRAEAFQLTPKGVAFLEGQCPVDSFLFKLKGSNEIRRDGDADPLYAGQVVEDDPDELNDAEQHMVQAQAVFNSSPLPL